MQLAKNNMHSIEAQANHFLSNFDDDLVSYNTPYSEEEFVDFDGDGGNALGFANEIETGRRYSITIDNSANNADQTSILFGSFDPSTPAAVARTLTAAASVTGAALGITGSPTRLEGLQRFLERNPSRVMGFKVESNQSAQISKSLTLFKKSPFNVGSSEPIYLQDYTNEHAFQDKKVTVQKVFQLDDQTEVQFVVAANAITNITFFFGGILNPAKGLKKKARNAGVAGSGARLA